MDTDQDTITEAMDHVAEAVTEATAETEAAMQTAEQASSAEVTATAESLRALAEELSAKADALLQSMPADADTALEATAAAMEPAVEATPPAMAEVATGVVEQAAAAAGMDFLSLFTVFVLACFVGYYVVWRVTPALHSPLMGVTNAVSSVIIVGALIAAGPDIFTTSKILGFFAVMLAAVNIFGGFIVTQRMLSMFRKKGA